MFEADHKEWNVLLTYGIRPFERLGVQRPVSRDHLEFQSVENQVFAGCHGALSLKEGKKSRGIQPTAGSHREDHQEISVNRVDRGPVKFDGQPASEGISFDADFL